MKNCLSNKILTIAIAACLVACAFLFAGCGSSGSGYSTNISKELTHESSAEITHATGFSIDYYKDGYKLITIDEEGQFLIVPEGKEAPSDLSSEIVVIKQPVQNIYLVATATMDMFRSIDALDSIKMTGTKASDWYIPEAVERMEGGQIVYAGKYSMPDYEVILSNNCDLAIESGMIYHTPDVKEALEARGIPVMVDLSSYEGEPLGRVEWVKVYGAITNHEDEANAAFEQQRQLFAEATSGEKLASTPTVAFFYITTSGAVSVRVGDDYIPKMIELAGGKYVYSDLVNENSNASSKTLQMENFYEKAKNADVLIYNSTIDSTMNSIDDMIGKSEFLANFDAVKAGHVWITSQNMYQDSMEFGYFIVDVKKILQNPEVSDDELVYLRRMV
ncbi:MAG: ABC transporter substrate-binding protein [Eggerthellaceae bacterium]|nr:ABC transporter substrate-binding protein [Eggerthellaceae bacterium]